MYYQIKTELKYYRLAGFTGHIKFGVENGKVVSESISTKLEQSPGVTNSDYELILQSIADARYYGSIDYNLNNGFITNMNYQKNWQGENLQKKIEADKCKSVIVVEKR